MAERNTNMYGKQLPGVPQSWAADAPIGTNQPTVAFGKIVGGMPNQSRTAKGGLRTYRGKRN